MKTAVSLPDDLFDEAERTAQALGIPRSQLYARALEEFIAHHQGQDITERLNQVYGNETPKALDAQDLGLEALRNLTKHDTW